MANNLQIVINSVDVSEFVDRDTISFINADTTQNMFSCNLWIYTLNIFFGQEIEVFDLSKGGIKVYGGLISDEPTVEVKSVVGTWLLNVGIISDGYERVASRKATQQKEFSNVTSGAIVTEVFNEQLLVEGFTIGQIDAGITLLQRNISAEMVSQTFNSLADANGFRWWIDINKQFFFTDAPSITASSYHYDLTVDDANNLKDDDANFPQLSGSASDYRNKQITTGENAEGTQVVGFAINAIEQARMSAYFGTGEYVKINNNSNIVQPGEAINSAQALINKYPSIPKIITLPTFNNSLQTNTTLEINIPQLNINGEIYLIQSIDTEYYSDLSTKIYKSLVTCVLYALGLEAMQQRTWTDKWKNIRIKTEPISDKDENFTKEIVDRNDGETLNISTSEIKRPTTLNIKTGTNIEIIGQIIGYTPANGANKLNINVYKNSSLLNPTCPYGDNNLASYTDPDTSLQVNVLNTHNFFEVLEGENGGQQINFDIGLSTDEGSFTIPQNCFVVKYSGNGLFAGESVQLPFIQIVQALDTDILASTYNYTFDNPIVDETIIVSTQVPIDITINQNLAPSILDTSYIYTFDNPIVSETITIVLNP